MSFLIAVYVNEGIVLASDRRTTYTNTITNNNKIIQRIGIHTTNSTEKTFICPNGSGISTCGDANLLGKPITGFIKDLIRTKINKNTPVNDIPGIIINYFYSLPEIPDTRFFVAGYNHNSDKEERHVYRVNLNPKQVEEVETNHQGASWDGEALTLTRLIQNVAIKVGDNDYEDLPFEAILWEYFTLQDAVDFARFAVETTIQTMRFKNVIKTVGGDVDILVITPDGTNWLQKKELE